MKRILLLSISLLAGIHLFAGEGIRFVGQFPTDAQIEDAGSTLAMPKQVTANSQYVFVIDQAEHAILVFDHEDRYVKRFGGMGQGPGELSFPHWATATEENLIVSDQTGRFHHYCLEQGFLNAKPFPEFYARFAKTDFGWFAYALNPRTDKRFAVFDSDFEKTKSISASFSSPYNRPIQDNRVNVRHEGGKIYVLQEYASGFHIYSDDGELIRKGDVAVSPFDDPEYKDVKATFTHRTFDVFQNHFVASYYAIGSLKFLVFDERGALVKRVKIPINLDEIGSEDPIFPIDMKILTDEYGSNHLWVLTQKPFGSVLHYQFDDGAFLGNNRSFTTSGKGGSE